MDCPNCATYNDTTNRFCLKCGFALQTEAATVQAAPVALPAVPAAPLAPNWAAQPGPPAVQPNPSGQPAPFSPTQSAYPISPSSYGAPNLTGLNIWGPFAGYGTRRRHVGWLMNGEGWRASELVSAVDMKFKERNIPDAYTTKATLTAQGVIVENRPYFILRRGLASMGLYIAQFGRDLFVSQVSYLKPPVSNLRILFVGGMGLFWLYMTVGYPLSVQSALGGLSSVLNPFGGGQGPDTGSLISLLCVIGPLGFLNNLALFLLLCFSAYKWLTEKDFLAALRVPPNEFNEDDLMAMEKAVEETVRQSLTDIKLNPEDLQPVGVKGQWF